MWFARHLPRIWLGCWPEATEKQREPERDTQGETERRVKLRGGTGHIAMDLDADGERGADTDREAVRAFLEAWELAARRVTETETETETETCTCRSAFTRSVRQLSADMSSVHRQGTQRLQREGAEGRGLVLETAWVEQGIAVWVPERLTLTGSGT